MKPGSDGRLAVAAAGATLLTSLALVPLVRNPLWLLAAALVTLVVMVTGIALRQLLHRSALVVPGQVLALAVVLDLLFTRDRLVDPFGVIDGFVDLVHAGLEVSRTQASPVTATSGVVFLLVAGTGLIALLTDLMAVTLRQTALAGLPLLALYCVPAALLPDGLPWYLFGLAGAGFLLLLTADADERTHSWGRVLGGQTDGRGKPPGLGVTGLGLGSLGQGGRRAAGAAVVTALVVPLFVPGLGGALFGSGGIGSGDGGKGSITRINPILNLQKDLTDRQDTELLQYRTSVSNPEPLRIVTADVFDGKVWAPGTPRIPRDNKVQDGLPPAPGLTDSSVARKLATTQVKIGKLAQTYLPLPYPATQVAIDGDWLYDAETLNVIGDHITTEGAAYKVTHLEVTPTAAQLSAATTNARDVSATYTDLPADLPQSIRTAAEQVTAGATTTYEQAVALQSWFRSSNFTYSTEVSRATRGTDSGSAAIAQFLQDRKGYCVHFASAMAVMARVLHIPARVAVGFLPGTKDSDGDMVITAHDAHAWPELYFSGIGWVRFEPTPRGAGTDAPAWTQPRSSALPQDTPTTAAPTTAAPSSSASTSTAVRPEPTQTGGGSTGDGSSRLPLVLVAALLLLALVLVLPWLAARTATRVRWSRALRSPDPATALAEAAWEELRVGLSDLGMAWARSWTPRAVLQRVMTEYELGGPAAEALRRLVTEVEGARYAPPGGADGGRRAEERRADVARVVAGVSAASTRAQQLRARWLPTSGADMLRDAVQAAAAAVRRVVERVENWFDDRFRGGPGPGAGNGAVDLNRERETV
ncbi:transglutaminaseTgpA domain-containing protein [Spongisporangium articulatum]|uniref:TransglutaminaseTgpA domain-containing protein n=1 Tax=Spongisporangium articulatum TaxID=3362603 RepID=A0ABW8ASP7_9ACTN